jgi:hypothetical protein
MVLVVALVSDGIATLLSSPVCSSSAPVFATGLRAPPSHLALSVI